MHRFGTAYFSLCMRCLAARIGSALRERVRSPFKREVSRKCVMTWSNLTAANIQRRTSGVFSTAPYRPDLSSNCLST